MGASKVQALVIAEGIPPIQVKILERMRRWEFVDLATLLSDPIHKAEDMAVHQQNQVILFQTVEQAQKRRRQIQDIASWTQAFTIYMAALASATTTLKEETVGLITHLHLINQLARELGGKQWLKYDTDYREWAAAKGIRKWGDLNLTIYGRCLAVGWGATSASPADSIDIPDKSGSRPRSGASKRNKPSRQTSKACFQWNFEGNCPRSDCRYPHCCFYCGDPHTAEECRSTKRPRREGERSH